MKDVVPIIDRQELNTSKKQEYGTLLYLTRGRLRTGIQMTIHKVENWEDLYRDKGRNIRT